jgi:hypothetical protein
LFDRTAEHKVNAIGIYVYNVDENALKNFFRKNRKNDNGRSNIADLTNLKCEESNHYSSSNCLLSALLVAVNHYSSSNCLLSALLFAVNHYSNCLLCQRFCLL